MEKFLEAQWYSDLKRHADEKRYKSGETLCPQDEVPSKVGLVISGRAQAFSYSVDGRQTWVGQYSAGEFFGVAALLSEKASSFEITATTPLHVLEIPAKRFLQLIGANTKVLGDICKDLAHRQIFLTDDMINVHTLSVKGRICIELLKLANPMGIDPSKHVIRPNPIIVDLARRLNSTRETVSRTVSELQSKGILARHPGALIIESPQRLRKAVEYI